MLGFCLFLVVLGSLAYLRKDLLFSVGTIAATALIFSFFSITSGIWLLIIWIVAITLGLLSIADLRQKWISNPALIWFRKLLPRLSDTEREALEAGTVWWDAELFSGDPDWQRLLNTSPPQLSEKEQAFIDGPVEQLCQMCNEWEINQQGNLPESIWQFLIEHRFFSMIISEEYGGLGFSAMGNSAVVMKIASANLTAAISVMVPNSLGPGELLTEFGTEEQKNYYLPRLATGEDIPCFALTAPTAGSDAAAMPDKGIICKGDWKGKEVLGLRVNWNKRYITLAPVSTVLGLAFRAFDPDHLLGDIEELGITCALIPTDTPGVDTANRHLPVGSVFMNGPTRGKDVFIPMDYIIGGQERLGQGWRMLMHSLSAGRAISLPALGVAGGKYACAVSGEYARIRKQFGMPIAYFEGIEEPLARMAGHTYRMDAARLLTMSALAQDEKPGVLSAILKYQLTESNRICVNDAMDIHGGKGIIQGPNNYLAGVYQALPIAITVEGANILTRSLIVFGQGAIRNHPYLLREMQAGQAEDNDATRKEFDDALFSHVGFTISNFVRAFFMGLTGARFVKSPIEGRTAHYYRQLTRLSAAFAFVTDSVLLSLGGSFKFKEKISGRLADVLSHLYMASAILKQFEDSGRPKEDHALVHWAMRDSLFIIQSSLVNTLRNFPIRWVGHAIKFFIFPLGHPYKEPSDTLGKHTARILIADGPARDRLLQGIYQSERDDATGRLHKAFKAVLANAAIERRIKNATGQSVTIDNVASLCEQATAQNEISETEAELVLNTSALVKKVIDVDDFPKELWNFQPRLDNSDSPT